MCVRPIRLGGAGLVLAALCLLPGLPPGPLGSAAATETPAPPAAMAPAEHPPAAFQRAEGQRSWAFPRDHGGHPAYRLEWWYYTGIVRTATGRGFGYQVTFFRQGVPGADPQRPSAWAVHSLYLAHAALSDLREGRYLRAGRVGRDSLGLSGAADDRHQVWLRDWRAEALPDDPHGTRLTLAAEDFALALELRAERPPVLHGTQGLDRKGPAPGQASWYYSQPRLRTTGTVRVGSSTGSGTGSSTGSSTGASEGSTTHTVSGQTWMDHEFGSGQLSADLAGWDWLALRLDDGSDLMLYRLRQRDGSAAPFSAGSLIAPDGTRTPLTLAIPPAEAAKRAGGAPAAAKSAAAGMAPGRVWKSPATGGRYPLEWRVEVPQAELRLHILPAFDDQEQTAAAGTPFAYWEGVVFATGTRAGRALKGEGYLELTGYAGEVGGALR